MMEVKYTDGQSEMVQFDTMQEAEDALRAMLQREDVVSGTIHKAGSEIVQRGRRYRLNDRGQWERVGKKRQESPNA